MPKRLIAIAAVGACAYAVLAATPAAAQSASPTWSSDRFAVGVGGGTNGGSIEGAYSINHYLVVRAQGAFIDFDAGFNSSDTKYNGKFSHNTGGALVDLHPFQNPFFLSAGVVSGERKVHVTAQPSAAATIRINGVSYPINQVLGVTGDASLDATAPILGIGYDNTFTHAGHIGFRAFAGAIVGGDPKVKLAATGPIAGDPTVQSNLVAEQSSLQHDVNGYGTYPVVSVGLFYRF